MSNKEFEKFKNGLNGNKTNTMTLKSALSSPGPVHSINSNAKTINRKKQVSFYLDQSILERLGILKAKTQRSFSDFYEEALLELLKKYGE